jgi:signal transduction histidine kinase
MDKSQIDAGKILRKAFPGIPEGEADQLVSIAETHSYDPGIVLCQEGAFEDVFYIILEGRVRVTKVINEDEDRLLKILEPGDFFGEMGLIHNAPRAATVITIEPTMVLSINKKEFEEMLQISSSVSMAMVKEVSRRLRENDEMAIEDLRLKARELASAYNRLAQEDFARREFLTTIAHELRTPLTAANGYLQLACRSGIGDANRQVALDTVGRNLQHIISLVNDILFLQEVDLVLPEVQTQNIGPLIQTAVERVKPVAKKRKVNLELKIELDLPPVQCHFNSLEKAISKVLDNAIKFSPEGGSVLIGVEESNHSIRVRVEDQGIGIPPDVLPRIFDRFYRVESVNDTLYGGLGLGLAITKQVIDQHGGQIQVESEVGVGSAFTIMLEPA